MEITIKLHGNLKRFGNEFVVKGNKLKEGMSALLMQLSGFREQIQKGKFHVIVGNNKEKDLTEQTIFANFDEELTENKTLHIIPVIKGSKNIGGVLGIVVGVVLIAASWWAGGAAGWAYLGAAGYAGATATFFAGAAMIFAGVASMLTPTPKLGNVGGLGKDTEKKASTSFSNTANVVAQGRQVPLIYGEILTGSLVISKGTRTFLADKYTPEEQRKKGKWGMSRG